VELLANRYLLEEVKKSVGNQTPDDLIESELLKAMIEADSRKIAKMQQTYMQTVKQSRTLSREFERLRKMIETLKRKREAAAKEKARRSELLAKLEKERKAYKARLERLQREESDLRGTLSKLNILKRRKQREKQRQANKRPKRTQGAEKTVLAKGDQLKIRKIGSSFQKHAVGRYRGPKTISPVGRAKVVKRFGAYTDPVYHIKIFNESVTLKPDRRNAKVKSVLPGKVVFAKDTPMLGKVVIVEHRNKLHTIYAKMDKIAPTIRRGKRVKKGSVIGRVEKELMFEVTQKNRHIDPLQLIRLR
jgi:septal ring factor EnvC (AmiA/AmiB activator)